MRSAATTFGTGNASIGHTDVAASAQPVFRAKSTGASPHRSTNVQRRARHHMPHMKISMTRKDYEQATSCSTKRMQRALKTSKCMLKRGPTRSDHTPHGRRTTADIMTDKRITAFHANQTMVVQHDHTKSTAHAQQRTHKTYPLRRGTRPLRQRTSSNQARRRHPGSNQKPMLEKPRMESHESLTLH